MLSKGASIALIDELQELSARCAARSPHRRPQPTQRGTRLPAETHSQAAAPPTFLFWLVANASSSAAALEKRTGQDIGFLGI
jgi:hypothetical protein